MTIANASIITIGDELLIGQTIDTNSAWMAQHLNAIGIQVIRRVAIGDDKEAIKNTLDEELNHSDIVLITGGLGPTADDITKPTLCEYFGSHLVVNEQVLEQVTQRFAKRNLPILERNTRQAEVPDNCTVLYNAKGTAPGMLFEKVVHNRKKLIVSMPGVPYEMMYVMEEHVLPYVQQHFTGKAIIHKSVLTAGLGESFVAERIRDLEEALPDHIRLAYLPGPMTVTLRLSGTCEDKLRLEKEMQLRQEEIANRLSELVVALDDSPLEFSIGKELTVRGETIGLAESCTGGFVAHRITQVMGSAKYFQGSVVCYQNEIKESMVDVPPDLLEEKGAVCEEVAVAMAKGARSRLKSNYGFGVTGLLSPGGSEDAPVGTVWMAITDGEKTVTKMYRFSFDRLRNKEASVNLSLMLILRFIQGKA